MSSVSVVIVTYNSAAFISNLMSALEEQTTPPDSVIIVDSGSADTTYLDRVRFSPLPCTLIMRSNIGVCVGNNIGWAHSKDSDYVLYLNPDAFLTPNFIEFSVHYMDDPANRNVGMVGGSLLGYDIKKNAPTGLVDSTGVIQLWYGRIIDRDQLKPIAVLEKYEAPARVPSICSAVVLCRRLAISTIAPTGEVFDPKYFMYKDDIDFSWRIRRAGWILIHHPQLIAYHCRGWKSRAEQSRKMRLLCAKNDIKLFIKFRSPYLIWGLTKYLLVLAFDI